jgi:hypothetical protein
VQIAALHSCLRVPCRTPGGTEAADPPQILQQFALDTKALLAVLVDDHPRPALAEFRLNVLLR